jgi:mono/diheme cytochrome c family protein
LAASAALRDLQRAVDRDPSTANRLALADAYWRLDDAAQAEEAYREVLETAEPIPAVAFRRLGFLALQSDLEQGAALLEQARAVEPDDLQTLFTLGEVYLALGELDSSQDAFEAYLATAEGADDETATARLELIEAVAPLAAAAEAEPNEANLLALADAYWERDLQQRAVSVYFRVLTGISPDSVRALTRTAEALFLSGRPQDAIGLFERARSLVEARGEQLDAHSLLLLGNAHFASEDYSAAIDAWRAHLDVAEEPGRVPDLIASAEARLAGASGSALPGAPGGGASEPGDVAIPAADTAVQAQRLYNANCAVCHGAAGQGGAGPALVGNPRAQDPANVASVVRFGRGSMPGFGAVLREGELELLVDWVTQDLSRTAQRSP